MGVKKQFWTSEEEEALLAGVLKHGAGKWRTILNDPEYSSILKSRSNIDVKDKWRNIAVIGYGSTNKARLALERKRSSGPNQEDNVTGSLTSFTVDKTILEAITNLKRPFGPDRESILLYIEENFKMQPDMKQIVIPRLNYLTHVGTLYQIENKYRISPKYMAAEATQRVTQEKKAALDAAKAVAEAEFATAEAEEATRDAEEAEAEAEAARIFAKAAIEKLGVEV